MLRRLLTTWLALLPVLAAAQKVDQPGPVTDTYFGTTVADPFRHLENTADPAVQAWMREQAARARQALDAVPGRAALRRRLAELDSSAGARVGNVQRRPGGLTFFERRGVADEQFKLYVRQGGQERLLVDPEAIARRTGEPHAINYVAASSTGRWVAYGLSAGGSEAAELYVADATNGRTVMGPITRADYGSVAWLPDDSGFFFTRLQELKPGMPAADKYARVRSVFVRRGGSAERAPTALAFDSPGVQIDERQDSTAVWPLPGGRWAAGVVYHGTDSEVSVYVAPLADATAGTARWRKLIDRQDAVTAFEAVGDRLFVLTHRGASRFRLLETSLQAPDLANARVVVPEGTGVLTALTRGSDALYLARRDGSASKLLRIPLAEGAVPAEVPLPVAGSFQMMGEDWRLPGVWIALQGWTAPRQLWSVAPQGGTVAVKNTRLQPAPRLAGLAELEAREVLVPSHDGAMVPLSIVHKRGLAYDGSNPTLLWGYASYGLTEEPRFSAWRLAWLERGGVFAVANPRGSGAFGQDWYRGGFQATKPNSWKDFIATAEYLVAQKITSPAQLAIWGGSAGGLLVGRAMTERPDLFAAVVPSVGVLDMLRAELTPNGPSNIPEFGSHKTEAGFKALLAMSTYHQIEDGRRYPAVMLTHGVNDPRVEVWQSTKTAARLMQAGVKTVLLRLDYDSGHGIGDTKAQALDDLADVMAFALWQFGAPGFSPK